MLAWCAVGTADVLQIRLLGELEIFRGGEPVSLPRSRKTRALCAYLVATGRPQRRDHLADLLWDAGEDRRASLRWSLSRLRPLIDEAAVQRMVATGDALEFQTCGAWIDLEVLRRAMQTDLAALVPADLERLAALFRGPFLHGLDQPDQHEFQAWCVAERERWRRLHLQLLQALLERLRASPELALPHARQWARLAPDDAAAWSALIRVLWAVASRSEAEEQYRLALRRLHTCGAVALQEIRAAWRELQPAVAPGSSEPSRLEPAVEVLPVHPPLVVAAQSSQPAPAELRQRVQFCKAPDGVRIAYASMGSGPTLLKTANWMNHLEYDWKSPIWRHLASELTSHYTLLRYDQRGNGLSDWNIETFSFDALVGDLEAVVEAAGVQRFSLLGISQGCATAIEYAVRHPERVDKLVLYGGFARGWRLRSAEEREALEAMMILIRRGWGRDNPAFRQLFSSLFMPEASPEQFQQFNELQRVSCSPENAARILEAVSNLDITHRLEQVRTPALVLHCTQDGRIPFAAGRAMAAGIPGARFVALESKNHLLLSHEPAWPRFLSEVRAFLAEG